MRRGTCASRERAGTLLLPTLVAAALAACSSARSNVGIGDAGNEASATVDGGDNLDAMFPPPRDASLFDGCATATAHATKDPIYLLIVLDGSGSMSQDEKWAAIIPALDLFIDDLRQKGDLTFGLGLTIFSDTNDSTNGVGPYPNIDVPIAFVDDAQAQRLHARLDNAKPSAQTPTLAVLQGQYAALASYVPASPLFPNGKKAVVLMTDGVPFPDSAVQQPKCVQATADAFALMPPSGPITTIAVGIGYDFPYDPETYDQKFMGEIAVAGGAPNVPCDPEQYTMSSEYCHFQVTPTGASNPIGLEQDFILAFDKVRSRLQSCELNLDKPDGGQPVEPDKVNVVFTDDKGYASVVPEDPMNGWSYDDPQNPSKVILNGKACIDLKANVHGSVEVVLGCKTVVP